MQSFDSISALDSSFPDGTYVMNINATNDGSVSTTFNLNADPVNGARFPNTPHITHFLASQEVDSSQDFILTWDAFNNGSAGDFINMEIETYMDGVIVFETSLPPESGSLDYAATSVTIPAGTLQPGTDYLVVLNFINIVDTNDTDYMVGNPVESVTGLAAYIAKTLFDMRTTGGVDPNLVDRGSGDVVGENITHPNGNIYNQVLLTGQSVTLRTDGTEITRVSFLDVNEDISQVQFSGNAVVTVSLDPDTFVDAAPPAKYNQPTVSYVGGRPTVRVEQADENTFLSIFTVGSINAVNQALFPEGEVYDAMADVALLEITNSPGFGGILCANTRFSGSTGKVGINAPGVPVSVRVLVGDIDASGDAVPYLNIGDGSFTVTAPNPGMRITGGDLVQTNGASIVVAESGSTTPGFKTLITQNNFKSDNTPQPTQSINATFANEDGQGISVTVEEETIE